MKKILVITSEDTGCREDCNVYYSNYILVESDTLKFDEPIFNEVVFKYKDDSTVEVVAHLRALGYIVEEPECAFALVADEDEEEWEEDEEDEEEEEGTDRVDMLSEINKILGELGVHGGVVFAPPEHDEDEDNDKDH